MADVIGMWYREGRATLEKGSRQVDGQGTRWLTNCRPGDLFAITDGGAVTAMYEIESNPNDRGILLATAYRGESVENVEYAIIRSFTAKWSVPGDLSYQMQDVIAQFTRAIQENFRGEKGEKGNDGKTIYGGSGVPATSLGAEGDFYLDYASQDLYHREAGGWIVRMNVQGVKGDDGRDGTIWYFGATPAAGFGNVGDFNFNNASGDVHRRVATGWEPVGNFVGPKGDKGERGDKGDKGEKGDAAKWHVGSGTPASTLGKANDMYLDRSNGDAYQKSSAGAWTKESNIRGIQGEKGEQGIPGVNPKGIYSATAEYAARDSVVHLGSTWVAKVASIGVSPPQVPTTPETENWLLVAAKGHDGDGTGDMLRSVYDVDNDGLVDVAKHAETADTATQATTAGSVAWSGVQNIPEAAPDRTGIIRVATAEEIDGGVSATTAISPQQLKRVRDTTPASGLTGDEVNGIQGAPLSAENRMATMRDLLAVDANMYRDSGLVVLSAEDDSNTFVVNQNSTIVGNILPLASKIKINGKNYVVEMVGPNPQEPEQTVVQVDLMTLTAADAGAVIYAAFADGIIPDATTEATGIVRRASDEEAEAGEAEDGFVNPKQLRQFGGGGRDGGTFIATGLTVSAAEDGASSFEVAEVLAVVEARIPAGTKVEVNGKVLTVTGVTAGGESAVVTVDQAVIGTEDIGGAVAKQAVFVPLSSEEEPGVMPLIRNEDIANKSLDDLVQMHGFGVDVARVIMIVNKVSAESETKFADWRRKPNPQVGDGWAAFQALWQHNVSTARAEGLRDTTLSTPTGDSSGNFVGGVLLPDGRVFCVPHNSTTARIYNPVSNMVTTPSGTYAGGTSFIGGVLLRDNRVFLVPCSSTTARIYDPVTNTVTTPGGTYPGGIAFYGGVLLPDGRVFCVPNGSTTARIFDPVGNTVTTPGGTYPGNGAFRGGVLLPDGRVFCVPYSSPTARIYNPATDTVSTPSGDYSNGTFVGGVLLSDGRVFCVPSGSTTARIYDPIADSTSTPTGIYPGNFAFWGGALLPDGRVFCIPYNSTSARIYDPVTDTLTTPSGTYSGSSAFASGIPLSDGQIFCVPFGSGSARIVRTTLFEAGVNFSTSPYFNKY